MLEQSPQHASLIELSLGDNILKAMLMAVSRSRSETQVSIVAPLDRACVFTQQDAITWLEELQKRGGEPELFKVVIGTNLAREFAHAREVKPSTVLACKDIDVPPNTSPLEILQMMIRHIAYATSDYIEGNAVKVRMPDGTTFYLTDIEIAKKWRELAAR